MPTSTRLQHCDSIALPRPACTVPEAAQALRVTRQTVYAMIHRGELRRFKIGRSTRLNTREVLALIGVGGEDDAPAA